VTRWIALAIALAAGAVLAVLLLSTGRSNPGTSQIVPGVVGLAQAKAVSTLNDAGFSASVGPTPNPAPAGTVLDQDPLGGTQAAESTEVTLTVSSGRNN
jgi:beta-lactam-binding protein with PASTA domain